MSAATGTAAAALLAPWTGPAGGVPPFDSADPQAIEDAYRAALALHRADIEAIAADPSPPTFANSVAALEDAGAALRRVDVLMRTVAANAATEASRAVEQRLAPLRSAHDDAIAQDARLWVRLLSVRDGDKLDHQTARLVARTIAWFGRRGAGLPEADKRRLAALNAELATLQARFQQQVTVDADAAFVLIADASDLDGLDAGMTDALAREAARRGRPGQWAVAATRGLLDTVLAKARSRALREQVWRQWMGRGAERNPTIVARILRLRGEKARLLGFANFAAFATADRMAGTADAAVALCEAIVAAALPRVAEFDAVLRPLAAAAGIDGPLAAWDRPFYAARARPAAADLSALTDYLPLDAAWAALSWATERLYGLTLRPIDGVPVPHADVRVYEAVRAGETIGLLYADLFVRTGKRGTAWVDDLRTARRGSRRAPALVILNHCLQPAAPGAPVLLSLDNLRVLFHEMGHALHALLTEVDYPSLGILRVAWDMIELPSQLFEALATEPALLARFARHHATGAAVPPALLAAVSASPHDDPAGWALAQAAAAAVDLALHRAATGDEVDAAAVERATLAALGIPADVALRHALPNFAHIFGSEVYAAGYYSYHWADVMVADAIAAFAASPDGLLDRSVAERFRRAVLSVGDSLPAGEAYRAFAGRDPEPAALIVKLGLAA